MPPDEATEDVPWLSPSQLENWAALMALISILPPAIDAQLKRDAGMNSYEYHVLVRLAASDQGMRPMSDLAVLAQGSPSRLSHAVARLERDGYVRRVACSEAGRRTAAVLTEEGRKKLEASAPGHVREARRLVVDALTPEQLSALGEAARAVVEAIDPEAADMIPPGRNA
ncbi:MarR family winged helix-turn-helix transcriptional regulator [Glycomyces arizonensis]|uniref:MarR family winged helix-turn-helix transcriptional regulator n=1 Tax=Glycomyces arizonensis TaxID=256035 RepID=UPI0005556F18|nr:MarR family transcriptional regulator [Glycomyces arizonensis]